MKLAVFISGFIVVCLCFSCSYSHSNSGGNLTISESDNEYRILAEYPEQNTKEVEQYMNEKIGDRNHISFLNATIDAELTLDDGTKMYVVNKPGTLKINIDKEQNSRASYEKVKQLGEGLKTFLNTPK